MGIKTLSKNIKKLTKSLAAKARTKKNSNNKNNKQNSRRCLNLYFQAVSKHKGVNKAVNTIKTIEIPSTAKVDIQTHDSTQLLRPATDSELLEENFSNPQNTKIKLKDFMLPFKLTTKVSFVPTISLVLQKRVFKIETTIVHTINIKLSKSILINNIKHFITS